MKKKPKIPGYVLGPIIGVGAFAEVWRALNTNTGEILACKRLLKSKVFKNGDYSIFKREIYSLKSLNHENIIKYHSVYENELDICILIEFCQEGSLENYILNHGKLQEDVAKIIFKQIIEALNYIHISGFCHRDLKPSNILISKFPTIKLSDFGLTEKFNDLNIQNNLVGTINYLPPESFYNNFNYIYADIWSTGLILYFILMGEIPWISKKIEEIQKEKEKPLKKFNGISLLCKDLLVQLLNPNYLKRPSTLRILEHEWFKLEKIKQKNILNSRSEPVFFF